MCSTIDGILEKPSGLERFNEKFFDDFDPLSSKISGFSADMIGKAATNPVIGGIAQGVAGYFGGPWGAAAASSTLARERGDSWGSSLGQGAMSYGMASLGAEDGGATDSSMSGVDLGDGSSFPAGDGSAYSSGMGSAAGSAQSGWQQPTTTDYSTDMAPASTTPAATGYDTGAVDLSGTDLGELTTQGGVNQMAQDTLGFNLNDLYKPATTKMGRLGQMQMLQGGIQTLGGIYEAREKRKAARQLMDQYNELKGQADRYYAPGSPEAIAMQQRMERQDAAAGRRSQYGTREANLAAQLASTRADYNARLAPSLNQLYGNATALRAGARGGIAGGLSQIGTGYGLSRLYG